MTDLIRFLAILAFIAFAIWADNQWEINPQDAQTKPAFDQ